MRAVDRNWNVDPTPARFEFMVLRPWYRATGFVVIGTLGAVQMHYALHTPTSGQRLRAGLVGHDQDGTDSDEQVADKRAEDC